MISLLSQDFALARLAHAVTECCVTHQAAFATLLIQYISAHSCMPHAHSSCASTQACKVIIARISELHQENILYLTAFGRKLMCCSTLRFSCVSAKSSFMQLSSSLTICPSSMPACNVYSSAWYLYTKFHPDLVAIYSKSWCCLEQYYYINIRCDLQNLAAVMQSKQSIPRSSHSISWMKTKEW